MTQSVNPVMSSFFISSPLSNRNSLWTVRAISVSRLIRKVDESYRAQDNWLTSWLMPGLRFETFFNWLSNEHNKASQTFLAPLAAAIAIFTQTIQWQSQ